MPEGGAFDRAFDRAPLESRGDPIAQIELRGHAGDVEAAADDAIDEGSDHAGAREDRAGRAVDLGDHAIEPDDLTVQENNGHLGPRFIMDQRSSASGAAGSGMGCAFRCHGQL